MAAQFSIFISHVTEDEAIAISLKHFLDRVFRNAEVFVAGRDITGGDLWVKEIRYRLKHAAVILAVITPFSETSPWMLFEAGAGFVESRTIPICGAGITPGGLSPPLKFLQAREINEQGLKRVVCDIAERAELREPPAFPGIEDALESIDEFLRIRGESQASPPSHRLEISAAAALLRDTSPVDPVIQDEFHAVTEELKRATIESLAMATSSYDIPSRDKLNEMEQFELQEIARCFNIPLPRMAALTILTLDSSLPKTDASRWKKINARNSIQEAKNALDKFLAELSDKSKSIE